MKEININPEDDSIKMLVVDDTRYGMAELYTELIQSNFPIAEVRLIKSSDFLKIEEFIIQKPDVIFLDSDLTNFKPHSVFGQSGENLVAYIKEKSPSTTIVGISSEARSRERMLMSGVDKVFDKGKLSENNLTRSLDLINA